MDLNWTETSEQAEDFIGSGCEYVANPVEMVCWAETSGCQCEQNVNILWAVGFTFGVSNKQ